MSNILHAVHVYVRNAHACPGPGDDGGSSGEGETGATLGVHGGGGQGIAVLPPGPLYRGDGCGQPHPSRLCLEVSWLYGEWWEGGAWSW